MELIATATDDSRRTSSEASVFFEVRKWNEVPDHQRRGRETWTASSHRRPRGKMLGSSTS